MTKAERLAKMQEKHDTMMAFDNEYRQNGTIIVAGVDEAGRGPLAGPVVAACAILPKDFDVIGVDDSKKLSEKRREQLFEEILNKSLATGVGIADNNLIDEINILQATKKAMQDALQNANKMLEEKDLKLIESILERVTDLNEEENILKEKIKLLNEELNLHNEFVKKSREIKDKVYELGKKGDEDDKKESDNE